MNSLIVLFKIIGEARNYLNCQTRVIPLMEAHRENLLRLIEADDLPALYTYVVSIISTPIPDNKHDRYLSSHDDTCMWCDTEITVTDLRLGKIRMRHLDCSATDEDIGCCACRDHRPERTQYFCGEECFSNFQMLFQKLVNEYKAARYHGNFSRANYIQSIAQSLNTLGWDSRHHELQNAKRFVEEECE